MGETALLEPGRKLAAVRLSRSLQEADFTAVAARLHGAAEKGFVLAGTWISPCEQAMFAELAAAGFPLVRAVQDPLSTIYRPKGDEPGLFAADRYLLLSRVSAPGAGRGAAWHGINDALAALARNSGGVAVYVHRVAGEAAPRSSAAPAPSPARRSASPPRMRFPNAGLARPHSLFGRKNLRIMTSFPLAPHAWRW